MLPPKENKPDSFKVILRKEGQDTPFIKKFPVGSIHPARAVMYAFIQGFNISVVPSVPELNKPESWYFNQKEEAKIDFHG